MRKSRNEKLRNFAVYERRLKVSRKVAERIFDLALYVPEIRLSGKWVAECGFRIDDRLVILVQPHRIIIEKDVQDQQEYDRLEMQRNTAKMITWKRWKNYLSITNK